MNSLITTDNVPFSYEEIIFFIIEILKYSIFIKIIIIIFLQHYEHKNIVKKSENYEKRIQILEEKLQNVNVSYSNEDKSRQDIHKNKKLSTHMNILKNTMSNHHLEMLELENNLENKTSILLVGWNMNIIEQPFTHFQEPNYYFLSTEIETLSCKLGLQCNREPSRYTFLYISQFKYFPNLRNKLRLSSIYTPHTVFILDLNIGVQDVPIPNFENNETEYVFRIRNKKNTKNISRLQEYCKQEGINLIDDIFNK